MAFDRWIFALCLASSTLPMFAVADSEFGVESIQDPTCRHWIKACSMAFLTNLSSGSPRKICKNVSEYRGCMKNPSCSNISPAVKQNLHNQIQQTLVRLQVSCPDKPGSPRPSIPREEGRGNGCKAEMKACTSRYMTALVETIHHSGQSDVSNTPDDHTNTWMCPLLEEFTDCLVESTCERESVEQTKEKIKSQVAQQFSLSKVKCDFDKDEEVGLDPKTTGNQDDTPSQTPGLSYGSTDPPGQPDNGHHIANDDSADPPADGSQTIPEATEDRESETGSADVTGQQEEQLGGNGGSMSRPCLKSALLIMALLYSSAELLQGDGS